MKITLDVIVRTRILIFTIYKVSIDMGQALTKKYMIKMIVHEYYFIPTTPIATSSLPKAAGLVLQLMMDLKATKEAQVKLQT